jgi:HTH-type transcriptional regulator / antitoxin HigA
MPKPRKVLRYLMEQRGLRQADLVPIFKSRGYVSDVINGKRGIGKERANQMAAFFRVSPDFSSERSARLRPAGIE